MLFQFDRGISISGDQIEDPSSSVMWLFNLICHEILTTTESQDPVYEDFDPETGPYLVRSMGEAGCIERDFPRYVGLGLLSQKGLMVTFRLTRPCEQVPYILGLQSCALLTPLTKQTIIPSHGVFGSVSRL